MTAADHHHLLAGCDIQRLKVLLASRHCTFSKPPRNTEHNDMLKYSQAGFRNFEQWSPVRQAVADDVVPCGMPDMRTKLGRLTHDVLSQRRCSSRSSGPAADVMAAAKNVGLGKRNSEARLRSAGRESYLSAKLCLQNIAVRSAVASAVGWCSCIGFHGHQSALRRYRYGSRWCRYSKHCCREQLASMPLHQRLFRAQASHDCVCTAGAAHE